MEVEVSPALAAIQDITQRVILPAKAKGPAYALERAQAFIAAQSRANAGGQPCFHSRLADLRGNHNTDVSLRPAAGLSSAPLLHSDAAPSGTGVVAEPSLTEQ